MVWSPRSSRRRKPQILSLSLLILAVCTSAPSAFEPALGHGRIIRVAAVNNQQAAEGIREALSRGTVDAVHLTGRPGGYFDNPAIKILLPSKLQPAETGLRAMGYGPKIDAFVLSMNRAAEAAAPKAEPIFEQAIRNMSVSDAQRIVTGGGDSATKYFKARTSGELATAFTPIVKAEMAKYSVSSQYEQLMGKSQSGPVSMGGPMGALFSKASNRFDLNHYVVEKSLDGLFYMVGREEIKIRTNPAAQVTPLLRQVFGGLR